MTEFWLAAPEGGGSVGLTACKGAKHDLSMLTYFDW